MNKNRYMVTFNDEKNRHFTRYFRDLSTMKRYLYCSDEVARYKVRDITIIDLLTGFVFNTFDVFLDGKTVKLSIEFPHGLATL